LHGGNRVAVSTLADYVRERGVLRYDPGTSSAPGIAQGVIPLTFRFTPREPGVQRNSRRAAENCIKPGYCLPDCFLPTPWSIPEVDRAADRGGRFPEGEPDLLDLRKGCWSAAYVSAGHGQPGDHHHQAATAVTGEKGRVGPDLIDGGVAGGVAMRGQDAGDLPDVGGYVWGDTETRGFIDVTVDDKGLRGHTPSS